MVASNSDCPEVRKLYADFEVTELSVANRVQPTGSSTRRELLMDGGE